MVYAPAPLVRGSLKPPPWNVEQAFVDPAFQGLWANLIFLLPAWDKSAPALIRGQWVFPSSTAEFGATALGTALDFTANTMGGTGPDYVDFGDVTFMDGLTEFTLVVLTRAADAAPTGAAANLFRKDGTFNLQYSDSDGLRMVVWGGGLRADTVSGATLEIDQDHVVVSRYNPDFTGDLFLDGVQLAELVSETASGGLDNSANGLNIGAKVSDTSEGYDGLVSAIAMFDRALSDEEIRRLSADPFGLIRPNWDYLTADVAAAELLAASLLSAYSMSDVYDPPRTLANKLAGSRTG